MLATHDARNVVNGSVVGDYRHIGGEGIFFAIERGGGFALLRFTSDNCAGQLCQVIGMARTAVIQHDIVGDINQRRDRSLSGGLQTRLHPVRRCAVGNTLDNAAIESGATIRVVGADLGRAGEAACNRFDNQRFQCTKPRRR